MDRQMTKDKIKEKCLIANLPVLHRYYVYVTKY